FSSLDSLKVVLPIAEDVIDFKSRFHNNKEDLGRKTCIFELVLDGGFMEGNEPDEKMRNMADVSEERNESGSTANSQLSGFETTLAKSRMRIWIARGENLFKSRQ
ncbi:hypothetical protein M8C21_022253, partial [Ambrosia artemisiifolia]